MESNDKSDKSENSVGELEETSSNNGNIDKAAEESTRTVENSIKHQHHSIIQTDETITVIVNESFMNGENGEVSPTTSTGDASSAREEKCDEKKQRKKSVKFESDENIKKFIVGEEIVDKENPFKDDEIESRRFIIKKKSKSPSGDGNSKSSKTKTVSITSSSNNGSATKNESSSDFITKEEVLRESKYVPVYIKNPDSVLTYDRSVLEAIAKRDKTKQQKLKQQQQQRGPVPMPRKSLMSNGKKVDEKKKTTTTTYEKKSLSSSRSRKLTNYPDLADLKVSIINFIISLMSKKNHSILSHPRCRLGKGWAS